MDVTPQQTTSYWVRVSNSCGTANSATATVTVVGADSAAPAVKFFLLAPCCALDRRGGEAVGANQVLTITIAGACGVPSGATALAMNVTTVLPASDGYVALYPGPQITTRHFVSTLNFTPGRTLANNARVALGADRTLNIFNAGSSPLDTLIDISGYFK